MIEQIELPEGEVPSYMAYLPSLVRYDKRLSPSEKIMFSEITALSNYRGYCFASNKYFSDLYGCTKRSITSWIANLEKCGYIVIFEHIVNGVSQRRIMLSAPIVELKNMPKQKTKAVEEKFRGYRKKFHGGIEENFYHNNITNNISNNNPIIPKRDIDENINIEASIKDWIDAYLRVFNHYNIRKTEQDIDKRKLKRYVYGAIEKGIDPKKGLYALQNILKDDWQRKHGLPAAKLSKLFDSENITNWVAR